MKELTKEEVCKIDHQISFGDLKKFILNNPDIDEKTPVLIERIEDKYFEKRGWAFYLNDGFHYDTMVEFNNSMDEEQDRIDQGLEKEYPGIPDPIVGKYEEEDLKEFKEQFYTGNCISLNKTKDLVLIYSHY